MKCANPFLYNKTLKTSDGRQAFVLSYNKNKEAYVIANLPDREIIGFMTEDEINGNRNLIPLEKYNYANVPF